MNKEEIKINFGGLTQKQELLNIINNLQSQLIQANNKIEKIKDKILIYEK